MQCFGHIKGWLILILYIIKRNEKWKKGTYEEKKIEFFSNYISLRERKKRKWIGEQLEASKSEIFDDPAQSTKWVDVSRGEHNHE